MNAPRLPLGILVESTEERYNALPLAEQRRIDDQHLYLADVQHRYPLTWMEREKDLYSRHVRECVPCISSIVVSAARKRAEEKDIERMLEDIRKR